MHRYCRGWVMDLSFDCFYNQLLTKIKKKKCKEIEKSFELLRRIQLCITRQSEFILPSFSEIMPLHIRAI